MDKIVLGATPLKYTRELNAVFVDFGETLRKGREYSIDFHYSGTPRQQGRFGGFVFSQAPSGKPWVFTACEGEGSSIWWPSKDQWRDEPVEHGHQRGGAQRPERCVERPLHGLEETWATDSRSGTGA